MCMCDVCTSQRMRGEGGGRALAEGAEKTNGDQHRALGRRLVTLRLTTRLRKIEGRKWQKHKLMCNYFSVMSSPGVEGGIQKQMILLISCSSVTERSESRAPIQ